MMFIRPVERDDLAQLMHLAGKTGGGLTSLPADSDTLSARIERSILTWQGELPRAEQGYVFVLADSEARRPSGSARLKWRSVCRTRGTTFASAPRCTPRKS